MNGQYAELLPPSEPPPRKTPWTLIAAVFVPAAAFAAGTGLQRLIEGAHPPGDAVLRWLYWSGASGVVVGALVSLFHKQRLPWIAWGAGSPWFVAALLLGTLRAAHPVREWAADNAERKCHARGRTLCSLAGFQRACERNDRASLGAPEVHRCDASGCTDRWSFSGPFRPDTWVDPGVVLCSIVTSPSGALLRSSTLPGPDLR